MKIIFYITLFFIPLSGYTYSKCDKSFSNGKKQFRDYQSAEEYVQRIGIKSQGQFREFRREGKIPKDIPSHPEDTYAGKGWVNWGHFFGTNRVATRDMIFRSLAKSIEYVQRIGVASEGEYYELSRNGKLPSDIPFHPDIIYKGKGWVSWEEYLGLNRVNGTGLNNRDVSAESQQTKETNGTELDDIFNNINKDLFLEEGDLYEVNETFIDSMENLF